MTSEKITENERQVIINIAENDYSAGDPADPIWANAITEGPYRKIKLTSIPGIASSLYKKGLVETTGTGRDAAIMLTRKGLRIYEEIAETSPEYERRRLSYIRRSLGRLTDEHFDVETIVEILSRYNAGLWTEDKVALEAFKPVGIKGSFTVEVKGFKKDTYLTVNYQFSEYGQYNNFYYEVR